MRDALAQRLLGEVLAWNPEEVARERPDLQAMAAFKYDEYQQYEPGMRFIETLALWLAQFETQDERRCAYEHVKSRLIFFSTAEISHLVRIAYPDLIRPRLLERAARDIGIAEFRVREIAASDAFAELERKTLFLGLSDGAHTDMFRRANPNLTHEQVLQTYEITDRRLAGLIESLEKDLTSLSNPVVARAAFRTVVLLDDFTASGLSYIRQDAGEWTGKLGKFLHDVIEAPTVPLVSDDVEVLLVLYIATERALHHVTHEMTQRGNARGGVPFAIVAGQVLAPSATLSRGDIPCLDGVIAGHYDASLEDRHTAVGGTDLKYGFAACGLSTVLYHNTPNNSLALLFGETPRVKALFPRVRRHSP